MDNLIITKQQAIQSTSVNHPNHAAILCNLGNAFQRLSERTRSTDDLDHGGRFNSLDKGDLGGNDQWMIWIMQS